MRLAIDTHCSFGVPVLSRTCRSTNLLGCCLLFVLVTMLGGTVPISGQQATIRDSLSIRIVENPSRALERAHFALASSAYFTVGGLSRDPEQEFHHRNGYLRAVRLSDGRFVVMDQDRLHWFGADGKRLFGVGRRGEGPSEFRYLTSICSTRGDTVVVWDDANRRLAVVSPRGKVVRQILVPSGSLAYQGCFSDGRVLLVDAELPSGDPASAVLHGRVIDLSGNNHVVGLRFAAGSRDAVGRMSSQIAVNDDLISGDAVRSEFQVRRADGSLVAIVRTRDVTPPVSDADYKRLLERIIPDQPHARQIRERMQEMRTSTHWPAYAKLVVDPSGCMWMQEWRGNESVRGAETWFGFSPDGVLRGRLDVLPPPGTVSRELLGIRSGIAQFRDRDAEGVAYLRFIGLRAPDAGRVCADQRLTRR